MHPEVSIVRDIRERELRIYTDPGRVCRPLFVVEDGSLVIEKKHVQWVSQGHTDNPEESFRWSQLIKTGVIEMLDAEEEETVMISMSNEDLEARKLEAQGLDTHEDTNPDSQHFDPSSRLKPMSSMRPHLFTHCEIHPSMILGICASIIPFPDHNQVCRSHARRRLLY